MYFFTSDTHFGSDHCLRRENRPFYSHKEYEDYQVQVWNKQSTRGDVILHLGDFVNYNNDEKTGWEEVLQIPKRVNASVILIIGNNEERIVQEQFNGDFAAFRNFCLKGGFKDVRHGIYICLRGERFFLNHYPSLHKDDAINLFGHVHRATGIYKPYGFNVSADLSHFFLLSEDDIFHFIKEKEQYWDNDVDVQCY